MKEDLDKKKQYKKYRRTVSVLGSIFVPLVFIFIAYLIIAIKVFSVSYLYLAIGLPIMFCLVAISIFLIYYFSKKTRKVKTEIYGSCDLTTTNPLFQEVINEYNYDSLESLEGLLAKKCKIIDIDDYNNSIVLLIKIERRLIAEIVISETEISITKESENPDEVLCFKKSFTPDNFTDISSVYIYIGDACEEICKN